MTEKKTKQISNKDLDVLNDFVKVSAFYIEDLEDFLGEEMNDFWASREKALHIINNVILQDVEILSQ